MSRSRKKTAIFKDKNDKWYKRHSNKKIRKTDVPSGGAFRRVANSYDICDWRCLCVGNSRWAPGPEDVEIATRK
jgi:hypothetical protein